jgi:ligand-binding sensor domain-containing protein
MKRRIELIIILLGAFLQSGAQSSFHLRHFTSQNELPQNSVNFLEFDAYGYLWFATEAGLARFDGTNFKNV